MNTNFEFRNRLDRLTRGRAEKSVLTIDGTLTIKAIDLTDAFQGICH